MPRRLSVPMSLFSLLTTLALLLLAGPDAVAAQAVTLNLTTEDYPPFNIVDARTGQISGIATEKVQELMHRAGEVVSISAFPWSRSFQMGQKLPNTCVFSTTRTPEREPMFKWVGPLVKNRWVIFARADDGRNPKTLEDLRPYVLGVYRNDAVGEYLAGKGFKTDVANMDADNPRKLLIGRFDFWATGELLGLEILRNQGLGEQIVPLFPFNNTEMYLACNKGMAQKRIDRFNHILHQMERDGTAQAIEKKYK